MGHPPTLAITELRGTQIRLRPFRPEEIDAAWQGWPSRTRRRIPDPDQRIADLTPRRGSAGVLSARGGRGEDASISPLSAKAGLSARFRLGLARSRLCRTGLSEIGVILYRPLNRGRGFGREAVELLTGWLLYVAEDERVQASTAAGNTAMRAVLERLGFSLEGILRAFGASSAGTRIDGAMYAVVRSEWVGQLPGRPMTSGSRSPQLRP